MATKRRAGESVHGARPVELVPGVWFRPFVGEDGEQILMDMGKKTAPRCPMKGFHGTGRRATGVLTREDGRILSIVCDTDAEATAQVWGGDR